MTDDERTALQRERLALAVREECEAFDAIVRGHRPAPGDAPREWPCVLAMLCVLAACLLVLFGVSVSCGAPAPAYRAKAAPLGKRIEGGWVMDWGASTWTTYFSPQGFWGCSRGEEHWHGDWSLDGRTLTLRARKLDEPDSPLATWAVTLDGGEQVRGGAVGTIDGGTAFALRPEPDAARR